MGGRDPTLVRRVLGTAILANPGRSMGNQQTRHDVDSQTWRNFSWGGRLSEMGKNKAVLPALLAWPQATSLQLQT